MTGPKENTQPQQTPQPQQVPLELHDRNIVVENDKESRDMTTTPAMCVVRIKRKREDDPVDSLSMSPTNYVPSHTHSLQP